MASLAKIDRMIRSALRRAGIDPSPASVSWSEREDEDHRNSRRRYASVGVEDLDFGFARATADLNEDHLRALVAHEVGHVIAYQRWNDLSEDGADRAAREVLGTPICYDHNWPGKGLQVVCSSKQKEETVMRKRNTKPAVQFEGRQRVKRTDRYEDSDGTMDKGRATAVASHAGSGSVKRSDRYEESDGMYKRNPLYPDEISQSEAYSTRLQERAKILKEEIRKYVRAAMLASRDQLRRDRDGFIDNLEETIGSIAGDAIAQEIRISNPGHVPTSNSVARRLASGQSR